MKIHIKNEIFINSEPLELTIKSWWKRFSLYCILLRSKEYYVHIDFGYYRIGKFDGFVDDKNAKLKIGDDNHFIISPIDDFYKSKQPNMIFLMEN